MIIYEDFHRPRMFLPLYQESGVPAKNRYPSRAAMILQRTLKGRLPQRLFYARLKVRDGDDKIIVFDSGSSPQYLNWLCGRYPDARIILYFWNPVNDYSLDQLDPRVEIWTYSEKDSLKYNIGYNPQFYFDVLADEAAEFEPSPCPARPKIFFAGREKGRTDVLADLQRRLEASGAEVQQFLVPRPKHFQHLAHLMEKTVPYRVLVEMLKQADIILDYSLDPYAGLSLRPMEALFWGKKLITNSNSVLTADFYHPGNIYVLGKDDRTFEEFFSCDPQPVEPSIRDRYRLSNWLKRFDEVTNV